LLFGPVFTREVVIAPRRPRTYIARAAYVCLLLVLMCTAWLVLTGTQTVRDVGDVARFGVVLFQLLSPLQLSLAMFFSAMLAASAVAQEKDRRTMVLLLLTRLSNGELVLGKLLASLLQVLVMLAAGLPLFMLAALLGGISYAQIARVFAVTVGAVLVCGSLGSTFALWREKTFQALAMTVLVLVLWVAVGEMVAAALLGESWCGIPASTWAVTISPWQAISEAVRPYAEEQASLGPLLGPTDLFLLASIGTALVLNGVSVLKVRRWQCAQEDRPVRRDEEPGPRESVWGAEHDLRGQGSGFRVQDQTSIATASASSIQAPSPKPKAPRPKPSSRPVWDNPVLWREMRTWAYGRKMLILRLAYLALFALAAGALEWMMRSGAPLTVTRVALALVPVVLLSLMLVNAQAVTSITGERDGRAMDLLLVTDLTPKEIVFGKLGGVFYNTKEMVLLPMLLCGYLWWTRVLGLENLIYLLGGIAVLYVFVAMVGVHAGVIYENSRSAIATSLGTVFFLFLGVATCMRIMLAFSGSFQVQLPPFLVFMIGGGVGLYVALGARNPSKAIGLASFICPFATFYVITSFLLGYTLGVFLITVMAYGFFVLAMLIPAIYEFDVATGRTTVDEG
jgi:ABC-type transport system involved in multi-copper enzyme maturation permease subunit